MKNAICNSKKRLNISKYNNLGSPKKIPLTLMQLNTLTVCFKTGYKKQSPAYRQGIVKKIT